MNSKKWERSARGETGRPTLRLGDTDFPISPEGFGNGRSERRVARPAIYRRPFAAPELFEADGHSLLLKDGPHTPLVALRKAKAGAITGT
jgi:hypothetical protein